MNCPTPCGDDKLCEHCKHFRRHYVRLRNNHYLPISKGHCTHPRIKDRCVDSPACDRFAPCPAPKD